MAEVLCRPLLFYLFLITKSVDQRLSKNLGKILSLSVLVPTEQKRSWIPYSPHTQPVQDPTVPEGETCACGPLTFS